MEKKIVNKKNKEEKDILLSDSDDSLPDLGCDTCGIAFSDAKNYQSHMQGKKHKKKVSEEKFLTKSLAAQKEDMGDDDDDDDDDDSKEIHCEICDKDMSGYISYATHLKGSTHAKNVKKQKLKQKLKDMPEVIDNGQEENASDDDELIGKPYARCSACKKEFTGPESFNRHINSAAHKKKLNQTQLEQTLKAKYDDGTNKSDGEEFFSKCADCKKSFSGMIPYQMHMKSNAHKKSLEKKKVAEEVKEFSLNGDSTDEFVCKECKKVFTDPLAFKSHLKNNSHEKLKAKNALKEFLTSHPEIVFVAPFDHGDSEEEDSNTDDSNSKFYLICKVCHMSFSGPESAQDHVKSKKHVAAKKEKNLKNLLKEQKKAPSEVKSGDGKEDPAKTASSPANGNSMNGKTKTDEKSENLEDFEMV